MAGRPRSAIQRIKTEAVVPPDQKNPKGRPPKYSDEWITEEAKALRDWLADDSIKKIYIGSFARLRGYGRQRLAEFARSNKQFADAYEEAKLWQEENFLQKGLTKEWDPNFTFIVMARVQSQEWKKSWDREPDEEKKDTTINININKLEKCSDA
jgi:hypothetical protein